MIIKKIKIQQIIVNFIIINANDFDTISNSLSMNGIMNMNFFLTASSFRTPFDSGTNDEVFSININDVIGTEYAKVERMLKKFNVLNTNQRTLKKRLSKINVTDGRIFFKNKLFVPDVG